jgi:hypothetical protein
MMMPVAALNDGQVSSVDATDVHAEGAPFIDLDIVKDNEDITTRLVDNDRASAGKIWCYVAGVETAYLDFERAALFHIDILKLDVDVAAILIYATLTGDVVSSV